MDMKSIWKLIAAIAIVGGLAACKKDGPQDQSENYFTIGDKTYQIAQAAGYLEVEDQAGYDFFLTSNPALKITGMLMNPDDYKKSLYIDVPSEKIGETLTIGEDDFDGSGWDFYFYSIDEEGVWYGASNYSDFSSGYFESSLTGTTLKMKWDLVHNGVKMTGQYSGPVAMKDFYIVND